MIEKAIEKIKAEMDKGKGAYIKVIGKYVLRHIEINKKAAEKIASGEKTLKGSIEAMRKEAEKNKSDNVGVLTDEEGFRIVRKYFEFEAIQDEIMGVKVQEIKEEIKAPIEEAKANNKKIEFKVDMTSLFE